MAKLKDIPDELLLPILNDLSRRDWISLSLVAPRLRQISQELLLHSVYLTDSRRQLPSLIRLLVQNPDLRPCLRSFSTPTSLGNVARVADWTLLITEAKKAATALGFKKLPWFGALQGGFLPACIGLVLVLASRLEGLNLKRNDDGPVSLECMFSRPMHKKMPLASFPFWSTLRTLELPLKALDARWLSLPKLHTLEVDCPMRFHDDDIWLNLGAGFAIEKLVLNCSTMVVYSWNEAYYGYLKKLANHFSGVKHVQITYTNWEQKKDRQGNLHWAQTMYEGLGSSFTRLVKLLEPMAPSLKSLEIVSLDDYEHDISDCLVPVDTLRHFTKLKCLSVPHTALCNEVEQEFQRLPRTNPVQVLPASLESLVIYDPRPQIMAWISRLPDHRHELPQLREVILDFLYNAQNTLSVFECCEEHLINSFLDAGIRIWCRNVHIEALDGDLLGNYMFGCFDEA